MDKRNNHIHAASDVCQLVDASRVNTSADPSVTSDFAGADRASDESEPNDIVKQSEQASVADPGDRIEISNENQESKPKSMKWLRRYETNQGCVNCIDMDPRRR